LSDGNFWYDRCSDRSGSPYGSANDVVVERHRSRYHQECRHGIDLFAGSWSELPLWNSVQEQRCQCLQERVNMDTPEFLKVLFKIYCEECKQNHERYEFCECHACIMKHGTRISTYPPLYKCDKCGKMNWWEPNENE